MEAAAAIIAQNSPQALEVQQGEIRTTKNQLGMDDFFKLLTTQLVSQDPLEPMQDTEFISQMANFSSLAQMESMATNMKTLREQQEGFAVQNLIGKYIRADNDGVALQGYVTKVERVDGQMVPYIGDVRVPYLQITEITDFAPAPSGGNTSEESEG
jgi:flagellar basal-body rod modification protein FlgD